MLVTATAKAVRISPKKAREVASLLKRRTVDDALTILEHTPRRAAQPIAKILNSAKANASNNFSLKEDSLMINSIQVNTAGAYKRWRPAARGRALTYKHRLSHITVVVEGIDKPKTDKKTTEKSSKPEVKQTTKPEKEAK